MKYNRSSNQIKNIVTSESFTKRNDKTVQMSSTDIRMFMTTRNCPNIFIKDNEKDKLMRKSQNNQNLKTEINLERFKLNKNLKTNQTTLKTEVSLGTKYLSTSTSCKNTSYTQRSRQKKLDSFRTLIESNGYKTENNTVKIHNPYLKSKLKTEHFLDSIVPHKNQVAGLSLNKLNKFDEDKKKVRSFKQLWKINKTVYSVEDKYKFNMEDFNNKTVVVDNEKVDYYDRYFQKEMLVKQTKKSKDDMKKFYKGVVDFTKIRMPDAFYFKKIRKTFEALDNQNQQNLPPFDKHVFKYKNSNTDQSYNKDCVSTIDPYVTVGYSFLSKTSTKKVKKEMIQKNYIKRYLEKFKNHQNLGMIQCLKQAKLHFENFISKLDGRIFTITLPDDLQVAVRDASDYYISLGQIQNDKNLFRLDDFDHKRFSELSSSSTKKDFTVDLEKEESLKELAESVVVDIIKSEAVSEKKLNNKIMTSIGNIIEEKNYFQEQAPASHWEKKGDELSVRPGSIIFTVGKKPKYRSYWLNCVDKCLKSYENSGELDENLNIGYYMTKKWNFKRNLLMGIISTKIGKIKRTHTNNIEFPSLNIAKIENTLVRTLNDLSDSQLTGAITERDPPQKNDINYTSQRNVFRSSENTLPSKKQWLNKRVNTFVSKPNEVSENKQYYVWTGRNPLLEKEYAPYEKIRRLDLYQMENYNELEEEYGDLIEAQINLCFTFEMDSICDNNFCENHQFELLAEDIGWVHNEYDKDCTLMNGMQNQHFFDFSADCFIMIEDYINKIIKTYDIELLKNQENKFSTMKSFTKKDEKPQISESTQELEEKFPKNEHLDIVSSFIGLNNSKEDIDNNISEDPEKVLSKSGTINLE